MEEKKLKVINIGLISFFDALEKQECKVIQLEWKPPVKIDEEIMALLDELI